jgi:hypothetical protein
VESANDQADDAKVVDVVECILATRERNVVKVKKLRRRCVFDRHDGTFLAYGGEQNNRRRLGKVPIFEVKQGKLHPDNKIHLLLSFFCNRSG